MHPEGGERCKHKYFASLLTKVRHSDTGRLTNQRWDLCQEHYNQAINDEMKGYYTWYKKKPFKTAVVIEFVRSFELYV